MYNISNPKTALLIDNIWVIYLLGVADNKEFNIQAGEIIKERILPNLIADKDVHDLYNLILKVF